MAHSELLATVRRPLSPDTQIEASATRSEYERVREILEEEGAKFPSLQYDGVRKVAIVSAAPSPLHGDMCTRQQQYQGHWRHIHNKNWDGALKYLTSEGETFMVAVKVGLSQTYASLRAAISFSVCALRCRVGIALCINEGNRGTTPTTRYYGTREEKRAAIQEVERILRSQLQTNPFGPLNIGEDTWFGEVASVVLEIYRLEDETLAPETLLDPTQSFMIVEDGLFVGAEVPPNLAEITLGDCIPTHILSGNNIEGTPVNFFHQDWFEDTFRFAMLRTAMERVEKKCKVQRV
ncbi:hypothetical protein V1506DRAFT_575861 [Lipomyces tetrasporus]